MLLLSSRLALSRAPLLLHALRSTSSSPPPSTPPFASPWIAIYRYPGIRGCQLLARAKFVQTVASVSYLPYSLHQFSSSAVDVIWFSSTAALAIAAPLLLAVFSQYLNRLVGVVAMSEDNERVRFGYLSFWGQRRNKEIRVEDVLPVSESGGSAKDRVVKISWYEEGGGSDYLFLPTENCELLDEERAETLFGSIEIFNKSSTNS